MMNEQEKKEKLQDVVFYGILAVVFVVGIAVLIFTHEPISTSTESFFDTTKTYTDKEVRDLYFKTQKYSLEDSVQNTINSAVHIRSNTGGWQGSGVIVTPNLIATARHVVEDTIDFTITFNDGTQVSAKRAISYKNYDIGFIWLDEPKEDIAVLGSFKDCKLGEAVYAIGSPYGDINFNSVTLGIVSSLDRKLEQFGCPEEYGWSVMWQTDTNGEPGNSGCPVFSLDGKVRGILVGGFSNGIIYCIPTDVFKEDLDLIELLFNLDRLQLEEASTIVYDPFYNYEEDNEYYEVEE